MHTYTKLLEESLDQELDHDITVEQLLDIVRLFRPFSESMDEFLADHGYTGDLSDADAKTAFVSSAFDREGMDRPRNIRKWFAEGREIERKTGFQLCFAFGLNEEQTNDFFRRFYISGVKVGRGIDCHNKEEAVYYFCLRNGLKYTDAEEILSHIPKKQRAESSVGVYTGEIRNDLDELKNGDEMVTYLIENNAKFASGNVTACDAVRRLLNEISEPEVGLLQREKDNLKAVRFGEHGLQKSDDDPKNSKKTGQIPEHPKEAPGPWATILDILQVEKRTVRELDGERTLMPVLRRLQASIAYSFPDRQGLEKILNNQNTSYEKIRKCLILLRFYTFWVKKALDAKSYTRNEGDDARFVNNMNQLLLDSGYLPLYVGNPYDWLFLYASKQYDPLYAFRYIFNEAVTLELEAQSQNRKPD